jgi:hypothetical protein
MDSRHRLLAQETKLETAGRDFPGIDMDSVEQEVVIFLLQAKTGGGKYSFFFFFFFFGGMWDWVTMTT